MIEETTIPNWDNKPVKTKRVIYPQCKDQNAPANFYVALFVGSRGTGKSFQLTKMLKQVEDKGTYDVEGNKVPLRTILISPTAFSQSNNCFTALSSIDWENDIFEDYNEEEYKAKIEEMKQDLEEAKKFKNYKRCYKIFEKINDVNKMDIKDIMVLYEKEYEHYDNIDQPKYPDGFITNIIVDDMVGNKIFRLGRNYFVNTVLRNRHINSGLNFLIAVQAINSVPKNIRLNANFMSLFKFANKKSVIEDCMPNLSAWVDETQLTELYDHATEEKHSSLIADMSRGEPIFKKNFDKIIQVKKKSDIKIKDGKEPNRADSQPNK